MSQVISDSMLSLIQVHKRQAHRSLAVSKSLIKAEGVWLSVMPSDRSTQPMRKTLEGVLKQRGFQSSIDRAWVDSTAS